MLGAVYLDYIMQTKISSQEDTGMKRNKKYLPLIPKPLLDDFVHNKVIPFVGAGFSKNADIPKNLSMPDWNDLGRAVAEEINGYEYHNNALDTLSYYEMLYSRPKLIELLIRELHIGKIQPGSTYRAFCELFTNVVCTTNFDCLLEDSYRSLRQPISVIATEDRLSIASEGETRVLKLHGDVNHPDRMVVTEKDYDVFADKNPILATYVSSLFITNTMLLVGYSLDDYDFRSLWQIINSRLGQMTRPAYCIVVAASPECVARYQRRNIKVINLPGKPQDYKDILREFFEELKEYIASEKEKMVTSMDEKISEQLLIPAEDNRLCFISCSWTRIAKVSSLLEPVMREIGVTPVRFDDIIMPGDNWMEQTRAAIRKSNMGIVDVSDGNANVMFETGILMTEKPNNIIYIAERGTETPIPFELGEILYYTFDWDDAVHHEFANKLYNRMENILTGSKEYTGPFAEAQRLLAKKEYSASIVSATAELEMLLQKRDYPSGKRTPMILRLKEILYQYHNGAALYKTAQKCISIRNQIVHEGYSATKKEAEAMLKFAFEIQQLETSFEIVAST